jgi:hypothetical protein
LQPSLGGTSRMMREYHVRICEGLGVKFPGSTRHFEPPRLGTVAAELTPLADADETRRPSTIEPRRVLPSDRPPRLAAVISAVGRYC